MNVVGEPIPTLVFEAVAHAPSKFPEVKKLIDPRIISKEHDRTGRDWLASKARAARRERDDLKSTITTSEALLSEREDSLLVKLKQKLKIPDKQVVELQTQTLEAKTKQTQLPNPREMIKDYYEKVAETPLSNQEKRELLKPEVLSQLTTDEYVRLWRRLNPHFLTHVTRQGFRDHTGMETHVGGLHGIHNGFVDILHDDKQLRPPLAVNGLRSRDEDAVKMILDKWVLQAKNDEEARSRFDVLLNKTIGDTPKYPDGTAVHFSGQKVSDAFYGGETSNETFFIFPADAIASQHDFAFNWIGGNFAEPASGLAPQWNDIFVWPNTVDNPGISIDAGVVFLPETTPVDPRTGSKYASEIKVVDGKEIRVLLDDDSLVHKYLEWAGTLNEDSDLIKKAQLVKNTLDESQISLSKSLDKLCSEELKKLGFDMDSAMALIPGLRDNIMYFNKDEIVEQCHIKINNSRAKFKKAEHAIPAKEYWENLFSQNPNLKPKHVLYYEGTPTNAIYKWQQKNGIGNADTSGSEGPLLGFANRNVENMNDDPRANRGHQELIDMGNKIIEDHYKHKE